MSKQLKTIACMVLLLLSSACAQRATTKQSEANAPVTHALKPVRISAENADAAEPVIAAGRDGTIYVAWVEHTANKEANVMLAHLDSTGQMKAAPVRVNSKEGEAKAWHGDPPTLAVAQDGTIYVGWTARIAGQKSGSDLYLSASRDEGKSFAPPAKVNDDTKPASHGMHSLAIGANGRIHLAWLDERNIAPPPPINHASNQHAEESNSEVFTSFSTDGGRTFSPNQKIASEVCPCCKTSMAVAPDGRLYVSWRQVLPGDYRHIAVASSVDGGKTFSPHVIVSDDQWQIAGCPVSGSALAVASDGALRVLWYAAGEIGEAGLYWSLSRDGGRTFTPRRALASSHARGNPALVASGTNNFAAVWESNAADSSQTLIARLPEDERTVSGQIIVTNGELPAAAATGNQLFVSYISKAGEHRSIWLVSSLLGA